MLGSSAFTSSTVQFVHRADALTSSTVHNASSAGQTALTVLKLKVINIKQAASVCGRQCTRKIIVARTGRQASPIPASQAYHTRPALCSHMCEYHDLQITDYVAKACVYAQSLAISCPATFSCRDFRGFAGSRGYPTWTRASFPYKGSCSSLTVALTRGHIRQARSQLQVQCHEPV